MPELDDSSFRSVQETVSRSPIPVKSFNAFLPPHIKIVGSQVQQKQYEEYVTTSLRRIKALGGQRVSFGSGHSRSCPADFSREKAREQIIQFLIFTADAADNYGIQVNVSECNMINTLLEANSYVEELNRPNVSLLADFYHMQMEDEPLHHLSQVKDNLNYVHVADSDRFYPGSGSYPFESLMEMLHTIGYQGPISVECTWRQAQIEIPKAARFLKTILRQG